MLTFVEKYKEERKRGHRPSQAKLMAESYVSRETTRLLGAERIPLDNVRELIWFHTDILISTSDERFTARIRCEQDDDYNLAMYMPEVSMQPCSCGYDGWGREGQERGEFIHVTGRQTYCVDLGERLEDVAKYAPKGMSRQVKREWAVGMLNSHKEMVEQYFKDEVQGIGVVVTVEESPEEYDCEGIQESLWGIDITHYSDVLCAEYVQEVCEELLIELGHSLDKLIESKNVA